MSQTVQTQYGPVTGHFNGPVLEFLGIPYAASPIDTLRWRPTQPHTGWSIPLPADSFPPSCPQKRFEQGEPDSVFTLEGQEDCLYLNIWTPDTSAVLPVMVFIHGGGNQQGSTAQISGGTLIYHGRNLAERGNVVVITIQYRLGVLGYLVHPGLEEENAEGISGNYGVFDQLFALQWIQQNISSFGGDPDNVTIFGESAGGVNVGNLLTTAWGADLFHKAIIQSAAPVLGDYSESENKGISFVEEFIQTGTDSARIAYMRTVHADSITIKMTNPLAGGVVQLNWQPVVDGYIFDDFPEEVFQTGNFNTVPLMTGSNAEEMQLAVSYPVFPFMVDSLISNTVPGPLQPTAYALYPPGNTPEEAKSSFVGILTDSQFTATTRRTAQCVSLNQAEPVWRYFFTHRHTFPGGDELGSYHAMELFYVFNNWENATLGSGILFRPADDSVQQHMLRYWVNFASTGNPNDPVGPQWPVFLPENDCYINLKATPDGNGCGLRTAECDLWDAVAGFEGCSSSLSVESDQTQRNKLVIFPNPFTESLTLATTSPMVEVTFFDISGRYIYSERTSSSEVSIATGNLAPGVYIIQTLQKDGGILMTKGYKISGLKN